MRPLTRATVLLACSLCFLTGWLVRDRGPATLRADPTPPKTVAALPFPMAARVGANLYLQTAAEYRACCLGTYRCAEGRLEALVERTRPKWERPAVVMDLDETVLDNSAFQTFLYRQRLEYTDELWADYEASYPQDVTLIPGAKSFINTASRLGVAVVYISNRSERYRKATESALVRLRVMPAGGGERLYLKPAGASSDKAARREAAAARYNVLMYFGDNLRDFSESFTAAKLPADARPEDYLKAIQRRATQVDEAACHWGVDWFVLPNPVYGEWEKLLGRDPHALLRPTSMRGKAAAR